jgi:hypothetical protein
MTISFKKLSLVISASLFAVALISAPMAFGASYGSSKSGSSCQKVGSLTKTGSTSLKCVKNGKKMVWHIVKTAKVITRKPSVAPSTTPTISVLPAQSAYDITVASSQWNFEFTYFVDGSKNARHSAPGDSSILYIPESSSFHLDFRRYDSWFLDSGSFN